jgi:hypothetical protein
MATKSKTPWGEKHEQEADARLYEIAARMLREETPGAYALAQSVTGSDVPGEDEATFAMALERAGLTPAEVAREVRRVRARAEGRIVEERVWAVRVGQTGVAPLREYTSRDYETAYGAQQYRANFAPTSRVVPIIRRRIRRAGEG